jgi:hypothetical protein
MRCLRYEAIDRHYTIQTRLLVLLICLVCLCAFPVGVQAQPPTAEAIATPTHHEAIIAALQDGRIRDAYQLLESIETPTADDLLPLSMGVRLMLDHLYLVDATDLEMPSMRAQMDRALALADKAIAADRGAAEGWGAKALAHLSCLMRQLTFWEQTAVKLRLHVPIMCAAISRKFWDSANRRLRLMKRRGTFRASLTTNCTLGMSCRRRASAKPSPHAKT